MVESGATVRPRHKLLALIEPLSLLKTRRFGTFWAGSLLSNIGTWMQQVAEPWLVLSLSGSPALLGLDAFAMDAPIWVLTLFGGFLADHADRRRVIFFFQSIQMLCPLILVLLLILGWVHVWMIILLSLVVGITDALSMPAFQSIVPRLVRKDQIGSAIALNSTQFNLSRILGPALAGIVMAKAGAMGCFATNAFSYVPFLAVILWVLPKTQRSDFRSKISDAGTHWYAEIRTIGSNPALRAGLLTVLITSLFCGPLVTFAPVLIKDIFHSDASHFGEALAAFGIGGLGGAMLILIFGHKVDPRRLGSFCAIAYAIVVILVAANRSLTNFSFLLVLGGAFLTMSNTAINSMLQSVADDRVRGQTASLYMLAMRGGLSLGSLGTGLSVSFYGIKAALIVNGSLAIVAQTLLLRARTTRSPAPIGLSA